MSDTRAGSGSGAPGIPGNEDALAVQSDTGAVVAQPEAEPIPDPGLPPHLPRPTDVDERSARRAERQVATFFGLSSLFVILFCVAYFVFDVGDDPDVLLGFGASNVTLGLTLGLSLLMIGIGAIQWARKLMSDHEIVEARHPVASSPEDRAVSLAAWEEGVDDSAIGRRPLIRNSLLGALGTALIPSVIVLRDLGPLPGDKLFHTVWQEGMRVVVDVAGTPIRPQDMEVGELTNAQPAVFFETDDEGEPLYEGVALQQAKAKAAVILIRMQPDDITPAKGRENWGYEGILCYSKICTHVGCPISLAEQQNHHLLCPCHQSTFDLADNGRVVFGPAARALPQLPLMLDAEGYLVAQSDFTEPVGPSFWERH